MSTSPDHRERGGWINGLHRLWSRRADDVSAQPLARNDAPLVEVHPPTGRAFGLHDPEIFRLVLRDRPEAFVKSTRLTEALRPLVGDSLFLANGAEWVRQRAMVAPLVEAAQHRAVPHIHAAGQAALHRLGSSHCAGDALELTTFARRISADALYRVMFSCPIPDKVFAALLACVEAFEASAPLVSLGAVSSGGGDTAKPSAATEAAARGLRKCVASAVARHRLNWLQDRGQDDLVTQLLDARDPDTGAPMSKVALVDEVVSLLLVGSEKSASALAWAVSHMALHPVEQAGVADEADRTLSEGPPDHSGLSQLTRSRDVVRETLRLSPPIPMVARENLGTDRIGARDIPKGAQIVLSLWHLQRQDRPGPDPHAFRPGRWTAPDQLDALHPASMPFSVGPRACPGAGLALAETTLLLSMICRDWDLHPDAAQPPSPKARLTLWGEAPLSVRATARRRSDAT